MKLDFGHHCTETTFFMLEVSHAKSDFNVFLHKDPKSMALQYSQKH